MKKLIVLFIAIFVFVMPLIAVKAERDVRAAAERPIVGVRKMVPESIGGTGVKPKDDDIMPQLSARECIAILNEDYKRIWESEQVPRSDAPTVRYAITDDERRAIERIVASEGGYCPYEFQALVATCILNGCEAENMRPTDLFERGDFWLTHDVEPDEVTKQAVADVFDRGVLPTAEKVRYYYNPNYCESALHEQMCYVLTSCDCRFFKDWE